MRFLERFEKRRRAQVWARFFLNGGKTRDMRDFAVKGYFFPKLRKRPLADPPRAGSKEGFFSPKRWKARVANRRKFRVAVSGNRKWIFIGIAVVAVCGTIIYLSVTYGGGLMGLLP